MYVRESEVVRMSILANLVDVRESEVEMREREVEMRESEVDCVCERK